MARYFSQQSLHSCTSILSLQKYVDSTSLDPYLYSLACGRLYKLTKTKQDMEMAHVCLQKWGTLYLRNVGKIPNTGKGQKGVLNVFTSFGINLFANHKDPLVLLLAEIVAEICESESFDESCYSFVGNCLWTAAKFDITHENIYMPIVKRTIAAPYQYQHFEIERILWAFSKLQIKEEKLILPIVNIAVSNCNSYNSLTNIKCLKSLISVDVSSEHILHFVNAIVKFSKELLPEEVCMFVSSISGLKIEVNFTPVLERAVELSCFFNSSEVTTILNSLSKIKNSYSTVNLLPLIQRAVTVSSTFSINDASTTLVAMCVLDFASEIEPVVIRLFNQKHLIEADLLSLSCQSVLQILKPLEISKFLDIVFRSIENYNLPDMIKIFSLFIKIDSLPKEMLSRILGHIFILLNDPNLSETNFGECILTICNLITLNNSKMYLRNGLIKYLESIGAKRCLVSLECLIGKNTPVLRELIQLLIVRIEFLFPNMSTSEKQLAIKKLEKFK